MPHRPAHSAQWADSSHAIGLVSGRAQDGAFAHYTTLSVDKVAILPDSIDFTHGVVVPFALEAAVCALCVQKPQTFMPGVFTPALGLPVPALSRDTKLGKTLVVNGASASTGAMVVQVARAIGLDVIAIAGAANIALVKQAGAQVVIDRAAPDLVDQVVGAVKETSGEFIGIFDAVSEATTLPTDLAILDRLGGGHLALTHPPPEGIPQNVQVGMIFAVDDIAAPVWRDFVTPALASGQLQCLPPPLVVGKGLESVQRGLEMSKAGVSGRKLVIELDW